MTTVSLKLKLQNKRTLTQAKNPNAKNNQP